MEISEIDEASVPHHQTVRSVVKATRLLLRIADSGGLTAMQAAGAVGIPLGTAYHLLNTLLAEGMLSRDSARRYQLGPKIAALSVAFAHQGPSERLLDSIRQLAAGTGETAYVSVWRDGQVVAVAAIEGSSAVRVGRIHTELRGHEHARASGKVMLAHLDPNALDAYLSSHSLDALTPRTIDSERRLRSELGFVRRRGYALDDAEFTPGVGCVAAPILEGGICVGCLTISAPLERFKRNRGALIAAVVAAAGDVSHP